MGVAAEEENLWRSLLRESATKAQTRTVNVIIVGNPNTGKKALSNALFENSKTTTRESSSSFNGYSLLYDYYEKDSSDTNEELDVGVWRLSDVSQKSLLQHAFDNNKNTIILLSLDLSSPATIDDTLKQWSSALVTQLSSYYNNTLSTAQVAAKKAAVQKYFSSSSNKNLPENVLIHNTGVPLYVVGCKSDANPLLCHTASTLDETRNNLIADYIQAHLRKFCLEYGAGLVYTSTKDKTNIALLREIIVNYPNNSSSAAQVINRSGIYIPVGYDAYDIIRDTLRQDKWKDDDDATSFSDMVTGLKNISEKGDDESESPLVAVQDDQSWLESLEAAGANVTNTKTRTLQDVLTSVASSDVVDKALDNTTKSARTKTTTTTTAAPKALSKESVNPEKLTSFFENLLSKSEKEKKTRKKT